VLLLAPLLLPVNPRLPSGWVELLWAEEEEEEEEDVGVVGVVGEGKEAEREDELSVQGWEILLGCFWGLLLVPATFCLSSRAVALILERPVSGFAVVAVAAAASVAVGGCVGGLEAATAAAEVVVEVASVVSVTAVVQEGRVGVAGGQITCVGSRSLFIGMEGESET